MATLSQADIGSALQIYFALDELRTVRQPGCMVLGWGVLPSYTEFLAAVPEVPVACSGAYPVVSHAYKVLEESYNSNGNVAELMAMVKEQAVESVVDTCVEHLNTQLKAALAARKVPAGSTGGTSAVAGGLLGGPVPGKAPGSAAGSKWGEPMWERLGEVQSCPLYFAAIYQYLMYNAVYLVPVTMWSQALGSPD